MGIFVLLINVGLHLVEAGRSAILVYTTPIWVTPIAIFIFKEKAGFLKWLGLVLGIAGIIVLPSITTSLSLLGVPVTGLIFSAILLKEHLTTINVTAMLLIAGGLVCTILDQKPLRKK